MITTVNIQIIYCNPHSPGQNIILSERRTIYSLTTVCRKISVNESVLRYCWKFKKELFLYHEHEYNCLNKILDPNWLFRTTILQEFPERFLITLKSYFSKRNKSRPFEYVENVRLPDRPRSSRRCCCSRLDCRTSTARYCWCCLTTYSWRHRGMQSKRPD